jgi:hypothetical protein
MSFAVVVSALANTAAELVVRATDEAPEAEDVKAGWTALVVFLLLIGAVVVLSFSLVKQLRKAQAAKDAGIYGSDDGPTASDQQDGPDAGSDAGSEPENHSAS